MDMDQQSPIRTLLRRQVMCPMYRRYLFTLLLYRSLTGFS